MSDKITKTNEPKFKVGEIALYKDSNSLELILIDDIVTVSERKRYPRKQDGLFGKPSGHFDTVHKNVYIQRHNGEGAVRMFDEEALLPLKKDSQLLSKLYKLLEIENL